MMLLGSLRAVKAQCDLKQEVVEAPVCSLCGEGMFSNSQCSWWVGGLLCVPRDQTALGVSVKPGSSLCGCWSHVGAHRCVLAQGSACSQTPEMWLILLSPREEIRGNGLWLLGIVQLWTCQGQHLVNDSFVGVAGGLELLMMVMCCTGQDAGKYPASENSLSGSH